MRATNTILFVFLCLVYSLGASARSTGNVSITEVVVQPAMPGDISRWVGLQNGLSLTARSNAPHEGIRSRLVVRVIGSDGTLCGNTPATGIAIDAFSTKSFSTADLLPALQACGKLTDGSYSICFQFYNDENDAISAEECRSFRVGKASTDQSYSPPVNMLPTDNQLFIAEEARRPIRFQWTAVSPIPEGKITYRLTVWPMKEGQSIEQAIATNKSIVTKEVVGATTISLNNELPMPCVPPYICRYAWNVKALDAEGKEVGSNNGTSKPSSLLLADYIIRIKDIKVACTATPGIYSFTYVIQNVNPGTAKLTALVVTSSVPAGGTITSFTPPLNTTIASGGTLTITGTISASPTLSNICIGAEITDVGNSFWKASRDTCIAVKPCACQACDPEKVKIVINPTSSIVVNPNNTLTMTQPITVTTTPLKLVKSVKAELQYFEFVPEGENCLPCNADPKTYGNMDNGTLAGDWAAGSGTHVLQWIFSPAKNFGTAQSAVITFTIPPTKCCVTVRWCIRYVITFNDCTVCSKVVCYEKKKVGCPNGGPNPNHN